MRTFAVAGPWMQDVVGAVVRARPENVPIALDGLVLTVREHRRIADDVVTLTLTREGEPLPAWAPGAHLDLLLPSGRVRQYSLCGDPADRHTYRIAVRRIVDGGGGSREIHDELSAGMRLWVRGPRNAFPLALPGRGSGSPSMHFIVGGIGITPVLPMVRAADRAGVEWTMVYSGRTRESMPFRDELARYGSRVVVRSDDLDGPPAAADLLPADERAAVYCCGPTPMLNPVRAILLDRPGVEFHVERFGPTPVLGGEAFEVQLARSGPILEIPADRTALEVIRAVRSGTAYSCGQGFCGTCRVRVLAGVPRHRDTLLTAEQRAAGQMLLCVSRAAAGTRLVLDI
ncbi:PDR/VanB family oxidoreductase [Nocardia sp. NPDC056000]|uniref:PDR/VanB family oxidoreductase n=1 Tax=Nocardia sp. NPDC056000 TaxID=3345674 RepID=UPI0035D7CB90